MIAPSGAGTQIIMATMTWADHVLRECPGGNGFAGYAIKSADHKDHHDPRSMLYREIDARKGVAKYAHPVFSR